MHPNQPGQSAVDQIARALAAGSSRRAALRYLGGTLAAAAFGVLGHRAADARRDDGGQPLPNPQRRPVDPPGVDPCKTVLCPVGTQCVRGECVSEEGYCGGKICPAGTTCVCLMDLPGGSSDPAELCRCACPNDQELVGDVCLCPPGTGCSGMAAAGGHAGPDEFVDREYTTAGICCSYPQTAMACSNSGPGMKDGFATCCTYGVDCPEPLPGQQCAVGGPTECCDMSCWGGSASAGDPGY